MCRLKADLSRVIHLILSLVFMFFSCSSPVEKEKSADPLSQIQAPEGYTVEVAAGPELLDFPMFATLDAEGRLFVFESTGNVYEKSQEAIDDPQFQIKLLEDTDGDGKFDKAAIFADKVGFPQGGVFYQGSLYASSAPDLLRLTDTDGDGVADKREVLLSGWILNVNANSLIGPFMGPDGWLYLTSAIEGFDVTTLEGERLKGETARIWRVKSDGSRLEWISAGGMNNPVELTFTPAGEVIGTQTFYVDPQRGLRDALTYWMEGGIYGKKNRNISSDGLVRTGDLLPVITRYSRVAPAGVAIYRNTALGEDFYHNLFSAQFNTHRVIRHRLFRKGASFRTEDEVFLWSDEVDFHPTDVLEDGDGSLLVVETGGWFIKGCPLSQVSKPELKGAIYRVRRPGAHKVEDPYGKQIPWASLEGAAVAEYLSDPRPMVMERAAQQLAERGEAAVGPLAAIIQGSASAKARLQAIFTLFRIGRPAAISAIHPGLEDPDPEVRLAAVRSLGMAKDRQAVEPLVELLKNDQPAIRRQAATALGQIGDPRAGPALIAATDGITDPFLRHALIYALIRLDQPDQLANGLAHPSSMVRAAALIALDQLPDSPLKASQLTPFLESKDSILQHTALWVAAHHPEWSEAMNSYLQKRLNQGLSGEDADPLQQILISFCGDAGTQRFMAGQLAQAATDGKLFMLKAMAGCREKDLPDSWVAQFGRELGGAVDPAVKMKVLELIRLRAITSLNPQLEQAADDQDHPPVLRMEAIAALLAGRPRFTDRHFNYLYDQLQAANEAPLRHQAASILGYGQLSDPQLSKLAEEFLPQADAFILPGIVPVFQKSRQPDVGKALAEVLMDSPGLDNFTEAQLRAIFENYPEEIEPVLSQLIDKLGEVRADRLARLQQLEARLVGGDVARGRALYFGKALCGTCHTMGEEGGNLGPDLTSIQHDRSRHDILEAVVYPGVSFVREYETYHITTQNNEYIGIIQEQTPEAIMLGIAAQASVRIPREEIIHIKMMEVSLMPQGIDQLLTGQEMADLMAFVMGEDLHY